MEGLKLNDFMGSTPETPMKFKTQDCGVKIAQQDVPIYTYLELAWTSNDLDKADLYLNKARELQEDRSEMEKVVLGLLTPYPPSWIRTNNTYTNEMTVSQLEDCYYPLVDAFDQKCYQLGCNNYAFRVIRYFTDLCIHNVNIYDVISKMDHVCDSTVQHTKCGVE